MDMPNNFKDIDTEIEKNLTIIKTGIPTYSPHEIQFAKDRITKLNKRRNELDYEQRKDSIKVVDTDQPRGNSSYFVKRRRMTVNPGGGITNDL